MNKFLAGLFVPLIIAVAASYYNGEPKPQPQLTPAQIERKAQAEAAAFWRWQILWSGLTGAALLAAAGGAYYIFALGKNKKERIHADPATGLWPITREDRAPFWKRMVGVHDWIVEDPNLAMAPNRRVYANGSLHVEADTHGATFDQQMQYAMQSWPVQRTIAQGANGARPNVAMMKAAAGVYDEQARRQRLLADATERRSLPASAEIQSAYEGEIQPALTPGQALDRSQNGIAYIGQERSGRRGLASWNANGASTLGIFGANGTGKTSSVATMVTLAMVRWGWQLWILDGKDAGDWDEFGQHATVNFVGQHNIQSTMDAIWTEFQRREAIMSQHRARQYRHLPLEVQADMPQWGIVFEEYGATRLGLDSSTRAKMDLFLNILCQKARYTGWHGVFIDQRPSDYTDEMKGNMKSIVCFRMTMNQGHAVNAYQANKLADVGEFEMDGVRYDAFYAEPLARPVLAQLPVRSFGRSVGGSFDPKPLPTPTERTPNVTDLQEMVWAWRDAHPQGTQAELRRDFANQGIEIARGYAHECWHRWTPSARNTDDARTALDQLKLLGLNPNDVRLRGGDRLGTDPTHE